ncbi:contractile injection system protein, VgrG/Pvc8 family, partial [Marinobacter sp.]|uniref:contractile injection system protein, VgrG/Pvc8 family n=1 Tax=Marinobacter sp. TaxID=50741 RepID=UPI0035C76C07
VADEPVIKRFGLRMEARTLRVTRRDYFFEKPRLLMEGAHTPQDDLPQPDLEDYDYPGRFKADASGQPFTEVRLQALRNDASTAAGDSNRPDFRAGAKVTLTDHDIEALNRDWLLTAVTHTGTQPQALEEEGGSEPTSYHNQFTAIPADRPWRPQTPHRPLMDGPQM